MTWWNRRSRPSDSPSREPAEPTQVVRYRTAFCCDNSHVQDLQDELSLSEIEDQKQICSQCGELCRPAIFKVTTTGFPDRHGRLSGDTTYFVVRYLDEPIPAMTDDDIPF